MLSKALMGSSSPTVALIASKTVSLAGGGYASSSVSLSDLPIQTGDLIVFATSTWVDVFSSTALSAIGYTTSAADNEDRIYARTLYKTATSLESSINFSWSPTTATDFTAIVAVFRGYEHSSSDTSTSENSTADPPSIACSASDLIIATYHFDESFTATYPSGYIPVQQVRVGSGTTTIMMYKIATGASEDPPSITDVGNDDGTVAMTIKCTPV
jgi:hypothetical protein